MVGEGERREREREKNVDLYFFQMHYYYTSKGAAITAITFMTLKSSFRAEMKLLH